MTTKKKADIQSIQDRAKKAGLTMDELKQAAAGTDRTTMYQRIRAAGLTLDEVRLICSKDSDVAPHLAQRDADLHS